MMKKRVQRLVVLATSLLISTFVNTQETKTSQTFMINLRDEVPEPVELDPATLAWLEELEQMEPAFTSENFHESYEQGYEQISEFKSPLLINGQTFDDYLANQSVQAKLENEMKRQIELANGEELLYKDGRKLEATMTEASNECKACIEADNRWCPTSTYASGYCCSGNDIRNCPRASMCSDEFSRTEMKYMLCPNEVGCTFARNLSPPVNGQQKLYEQLTGTFLKNDICTFKISIPQEADYNDMMILRVEYLNNCDAMLVKGSNLIEAQQLSPVVKAGHTYTATRGINLFLSFIAKATTSGQFVFRVWYIQVPGSGEVAPTVVTRPDDFVDTNLRDGTDGQAKNYTQAGEWLNTNKTVGINNLTQSETIGGQTNTQKNNTTNSTNPWDEKLQNTTDAQQPKNETVQTDVKYSLWFQRLGGKDIIGQGTKSDPFADRYIFTVEIQNESSTWKITMIVMLGGVLPFFICLGLVLTSIYLPYTGCGKWLNAKKQTFKQCCCGKQRRLFEPKSQIDQYQSQDSKQFLKGEHVVSAIKMKANSKVYPSTDCDERKGGAIAPMTDDDASVAEFQKSSKFQKGNFISNQNSIDMTNSMIASNANINTPNRGQHLPQIGVAGNNGQMAMIMQMSNMNNMIQQLNSTGQMTPEQMNLILQQQQMLLQSMLGQAPIATPATNFDSVATAQPKQSENTTLVNQEDKFKTEQSQAMKIEDPASKNISHDYSQNFSSVQNQSLNNGKSQNRSRIENLNVSVSEEPNNQQNIMRNTLGQNLFNPPDMNATAQNFGATIDKSLEEPDAFAEDNQNDKHHFGGIQATLEEPSNDKDFSQGAKGKKKKKKAKKAIIDSMPLELDLDKQNTDSEREGTLPDLGKMDSKDDITSQPQDLTSQFKAPEKDSQATIEEDYKKIQSQSVLPSLIPSASAILAEVDEGAKADDEDDFDVEDGSIEGAKPQGFQLPEDSDYEDDLL